MTDRHRSEAPDAAGRLGWALRNYLWLAAIILGFSIGAAATVLVPAEEEEGIYRAEALVIARQLAVRVDQLPKSSKAIFEAGSVAERAVLEGGLPYDPDDLIPASADIEPIDNTPLVRVVGLDKDAELAARIANAAAVALAEELSEAGPGFGVFAVHELARVPSKPEDVGSLPTPLLTGFIGGISLAAGLIALLMMIRQPVVTSAEATELTGVPEIGHLSIRRGIGQRQLQDVVGLGLLVRSLYPERPDGLGRTGHVIFVGCGWRRVYSTVIQLITRALLDLGPARAVPLRTSVANDLSKAATEGSPNDEALVVIGPSTGSSDIVQLLPVGSRTVLLVKEGVSRSQLTEAVSQLPSDELVGFVFIVSHTRLATRPQLLVRGRTAQNGLNGSAPAPEPRPQAAEPPPAEAVRPARPPQPADDLIEELQEPVITDLRTGTPVTRPQAEDAVTVELVAAEPSQTDQDATQGNGQTDPPKEKPAPRQKAAADAAEADGDKPPQRKQPTRRRSTKSQTNGGGGASQRKPQTRRKKTEG